jgi:dipeptidyl aminopeptidase/acylaminoacyl peptidase
MTPARASQPLIQAAREHGKTVRVVTVPMGHHQMNESPEETLQALREFLR